MAGALEKRILVTGANKGIGLATVQRILTEHTETFIYLGSRDAERGASAKNSLLEINKKWGKRVEVVPLDVTSDSSVRDAARRIDGPLYGLVNNAGVGGRDVALERMLQVNSYGPRRVCETFAERIAPGGRVVIVTSASGPNFVSQCSDEKKRFLTRPDLSWGELDEFMKECLQLPTSEEFGAQGLGDGNAYGLSKACANAYMQIFARSHPGLLVSACTPGFIVTDMTRSYLEAQGKTPSELGMKTPYEGAKASVHLLFSELEASGWYYGSDAQRSPLHRYRSPGDPPYSGSDP